MGQSRLLRLENQLLDAKEFGTIDALHLMISEMSAEKGYKRLSGEPYYYHLVDVAQDLWNHNIRKPEIIIGALLHDYAEDVPGVTIRQITGDWGKEVGLYVRLVTKQPGVDYKNSENIKAYLCHILQYFGSAAIKTSDRKHNFGTLRFGTPEKWYKQAHETKAHFLPFFKLCRKTFDEYSYYFEGAIRTIEPHLWMIEKYNQSMKVMEQRVGDFEKEIVKLRLQLARKN